ncbi:hypothetical protein D9613_009320 [Agrocybe pediades]|uniref:DUF6534 domain-containing protein n=1 Tax=Agrocybe pediades TaxID=84607 RepID=A0A8H4R499_9AGAR|nr:hypothetical protein D9613_009320 [Agrocybe pediades]
MSSSLHKIVNNCQLSELRFTQWTIPSSVIIKTLISCTVQAYFTIKIVYLTPLRLRWWISCIIGTLITAHFAFAMETSVLMFIKKEWSKLGSINYHATAPFAIFAVVSDIMIAASLMYFLHGQRSGMKRTDRVITKLIVYAANRGLVTSIVIIVEAIAFTKLHNTLWFLAIDFIIGKLYANSLLATLNCRCFVGRLDRNRTIHTTMRFSPFGGDLSTSPVDDDYDDQIELETKTGENDKRKSREVTSSTRGAIAIDIPLTFVNQRPKHPESDNHSPC